MTVMKYGPAAALALAAALAASPLAAQEDPALEREGHAAQLEAEREAARPGAHAERIEVQLREAEERLAEAAAQVAELSRQRLPGMTEIGRHLRAWNRPVLGVTIGAGEDDGPVEGVTVQGVTPGSAAEDAGLRAGDMLTAINDQSLSADSEAEANGKLLDFMEGIEEGDTLEIEYLRHGRSATVEVEPRRNEGFAWAFGDRDWDMPIAPPAPGVRWFAFQSAGTWGDMEMVSLTEELGRYFGADKGLLVVRAPEEESLKLRDGDVIQSIDGREPHSVSHAMRILASYQGGETLEIEIMRDKKRETLEIEMPDDRRGFMWHERFELPAIAPAAAPHVEQARPPRPIGKRI